MRRILPVLLLLVPVAAGADDDFRTFRDSFRAAFGLMGGTYEPTAEDRLAAVEAVATFGHEDSTRLLMTGVVMEQERIEALIAERELTRKGKNRKIRGRTPEPYLRDLKKKLDGEYKVLETIERAFAKLNDADAIAWLGKVALRREKHWKAREVTARALGEIGDRRYVDELAKALEDKDARVRTSVLISLGKMRSEEALMEILGALDDPEWIVRSAAIDALGKLLDMRAVEPLIDRLEEEEGRLAEDCADALERITGQNFGTSVDLWRKWWAKNRERALAGERLDLPPPKKEREDDDGYYHGIPVRSARTVFIIDVSESMSYSSTEFTTKPKKGEISRLELAKKELLRAVANYDKRGTFGIIAFHSVVKAWRPRMVPATPQMKGDAKEWVEELEPTGTTNIYGALEIAFRMAGMGLSDKYYEPAVDTVFLLSDGAPTNEDLTDDDPERVLRAVREWNRLGRIVINTIGLKGHSADFMSRLASQNGGEYTSRE